MSSCLAIDDNVWAVSFDLGRRARAKGISVPATDILIAACALHHGAAIETCDSDFDMLNSLRTIRYGLDRKLKISCSFLPAELTRIPGCGVRRRLVSAAGYAALR
jgi:hypothetical protein